MAFDLDEDPLTLFRCLSLGFPVLGTNSSNKITCQYLVVSLKSLLPDDEEWGPGGILKSGSLKESSDGEESLINAMLSLMMSEIKISS